jgi:hypothetical protein
MAGDHEHADDPPSIPETVQREREAEEAADADAPGSLAGTERRGRGTQTGADDAGSLPGTEHREREHEEEVDAEQARAEPPTIPGTEYRERETGGH